MKNEDKSVRKMWENYLTYIGDNIDSTTKNYT